MLTPSTINHPVQIKHVNIRAYCRTIDAISINQLQHVTTLLHAVPQHILLLLIRDLKSHPIAFNQRFFLFLFFYYLISQWNVTLMSSG